MLYIFKFDFPTGRPIPDVKSITLWVSDGISLAFSVKIISYPKPLFTLLFENRTEINGLEDRLAMNAANHFTLYIYKTTIDQIDYGTYYLHINNTFGEAIVDVYILQPGENYFTFLYLLLNK